MFLSIVLYSDNERMQGWGFGYENADKSTFCDVESSELVRCIEDLPEDMPANDPRVDLIVKSLFKIDAHPREASFITRFESIKGNIASETKISIYEGEWPDMRAIPNPYSVAGWII